MYPVSPNTLIVTLQSIQMVFKMYEYAKGHERATEELKKAQNAFGHFENQFEALGKSLSKAQDAFEVAKGHLTRYRNRVTNLTGEPAPNSSFRRRRPTCARSREERCAISNRNRLRCAKLSRSFLPLALLASSG